MVAGSQLSVRAACPGKHRFDTTLVGFELASDWEKTVVGRQSGKDIPGNHVVGNSKARTGVRSTGVGWHPQHHVVQQY